MHTLVLARHCQTAWNVSRRIQGQSDHPLSQRGHEQARQLANDLRADQALRIQAILTSDLQRAKETARVVAEALSIQRNSVCHDPRLRECHFGTLEGLTGDQAKEQLDGEDPYTGGFSAYDYTPFGGENRSQVLARQLESLREHYASLVPVGTDAQLLVIGHGRSLGTLLDHFGEPYRLSQGMYQLMTASL